MGTAALKCSQVLQQPGIIMKLRTVQRHHFRRARGVRTTTASGCWSRLMERWALTGTLHAALADNLPIPGNLLSWDDIIRDAQMGYSEGTLYQDGQFGDGRDTVYVTAGNSLSPAAKLGPTLVGQINLYFPLSGTEPCLTHSGSFVELISACPSSFAVV
jgi:hypothetical protein